MTTTRANSIKNYITDFFVEEDDVLRRVKQRAQQTGLPAIEVPSTVGKLLYCLAKIQQPQKILEIGTLAGYSTIWLARALPPTGRLISLEHNAQHAQLARENFLLAALDHLIEVQEGLAQNLMEKMIQQSECFDLIFIDADKENYPLYLQLAVKLSRPGTLILSDNLIPKGENIGTPENIEAHGIYQFNQALASHPQLESILSTTIVGSQGRMDALGISIVR